MVTSVPRVVTIVNLDGGEAAAYERTAGRGQGSRASTVLCNLVVARVCADARAILLNNSKSHPDKDNPPVCFAVADNIFGLIHVTRVAEFYDVFHKVGGEYGLEFGDHAVHLHGTVAERNTAAQVIAARPTGCGIDLDNTIKRPDLTKKGADLAIVMGVPISNGPEEAAARLDCWVDTRIAATQERLNTLLALRLCDKGSHHQRQDSNPCPLRVLTFECSNRGASRAADSGVGDLASSSSLNMTRRRLKVEKSIVCT